MNTLTRSLAEFCRANPGDEKWLIAPTIRVGHQWIDSVAAAGQPVLNLHALTFRSAALRLALPDPGRHTPEILRSLDAMLLCGRLFHANQGTGGGYLFSLRSTLPLIRRLVRLLEELRLAGLTPGDLAGRALEHRLKAAELARLLEEYQGFLSREKLTDYPQLLRLAAAATQVTDRKLPWLLLPEEVELSRLERELLDSFPDGRVVRPAVNLPEEGYGWELEAGEDIRFSTLATEPGVEIVRAAGPANEIRSALRRVISSGWPLEHVEIIHTSRDTYVPLIYEILQVCVPEDGSPPVTFADGIASRYTRPGRVLDSWLRWIAAGFDKGTLVSMVAGGLLALPDTEREAPPNSYLALLLEGLPIGKGRARWVKILGRELRRLERHERAGRVDDSVASVERRYPRELAALRLLHQLVTGLLEICPEPGGDDAALAAGARRLLEEYAVHSNELDTYARRALLDRLEGLNRWLEAHGGEGFDTAAYLTELAGNVPVMGNAPQPGKLHVSGIAAGGHTGRPVTVIVGLDDTRWPPSDNQNPLLLDGERARLSAHLTTSAGRQARAVREFELLLSRLRGRVILSFSSADPVGDRELLPSAMLLPVYRKMSGQADARQKQMLDTLAPAASFAPRTPEIICRDADWWLAALLEAPPEENNAILGRYFPHLALGEKVRLMRLSETFGECDGLLAGTGAELDPFSAEGPVLSASGLQTLGACPRKYFYRYLLGLDEPREATPPSQWLDPAEAGQLLHEVLHKFLARLAEESKLPESSSEQQSLLGELAEKSLAAFRERCPVPGEAAFQTRRVWLARACRTFLAEEAEYCRSHIPRWLEASIGMRGGGGEGAGIGCESAVKLRLPGGDIRVRGRVDRIDKLAESDSYTITDYKSGGAGSYNRARPFDGGRRVQHSLYLAMVQERLNRITSGSEVSRFRYFFPAGSERGDAVQWSVSDLAQGPELIDLLCGISRDGVFAATENVDRDCRYCAYKSLCGDLESQAEAGVRKRENPANQALQGVIRVRDHA